MVSIDIQVEQYSWLETTKYDDRAKTMLTDKRGGMLSYV